MVLGYQRTLQAPDLYKLDISREAGTLVEKLEAAWTRRVNVAAEWNAKLDRGEIRPSALKRWTWDVRAMKTDDTSRGQTYKERRAALEMHWRRIEGRKEASLTWTLHDVFGWSFWLAGIFRVCISFLCDTVSKHTIQIGHWWHFPNDGSTPAQIYHFICRGAVGCTCIYGYSAQCWHGHGYGIRTIVFDHNFKRVYESGARPIYVCLVVR